MVVTIYGNVKQLGWLITGHYITSQEDYEGVEPWGRGDTKSHLAYEGRRGARWEGAHRCESGRLHVGEKP